MTNIVINSTMCVHPHFSIHTAIHVYRHYSCW